MRHGVFGKKLNKDTKERQALFKNITKAVIIYGRVKTTIARAKAVRILIEKIITKAKVDSLVSRRAVLAMIGNDKGVTKKIFEEIAPLFKEINGGYTRIIPYAKRLNDNAPMVFLELTKKVEPIKEVKKEEKKK